MKTKSVFNYHTQGKGAPKKEAPVGETERQKSRRKVLLNGLNGSTTCPVNILHSHRIIGDSEEVALAEYRSLWFSAYGDKKKYAGNVWSALIGGGGAPSGEENVDKRRSLIELYHRIDGDLKKINPQGRYYIRKIVEGYMPVFFSNDVQASMDLYTYYEEKEKIEKALDKIKNKNKPQFSVLANSLKRIDYKIDELSEISESYESVYFREQTRLAIKQLVKLMHT